MKRSFLISLCLLFLAKLAFSQSPCVTGGRIQSPAVSRVTETQSNFTSNCNAVTITWKGDKDQSFIVEGVYTDQITGKTLGAEVASAINCDNKFNCSITLSLKPGSILNWTIQSVQTIDSRTFYSYPLRGETAGCPLDQLIVETEKSAKPKTAITSANVAPNNGLTIYPNPVTGELTIQWSNEYKGNAQLIIMDASGKPIKTTSIKKEQFNYSDKLIVNTLSAGLYFVYINMQNGKSVSTKFLKK